ncbi:Peptidase family M48 [Aliiroseovarius halocynthiae]|uniref:M48 family metallopeptidase n=1 Tax=Aliiroseovarius halocynthiae TaxID=985055 RepID=A0A545SMY5_9RHOB|nr:M48 family metallopeptidase [Aliiroseovarius halocynthiae]TQV66325.1 M48 family metallopeptidase [Aliiroseovarius halocynthiae]SMR83297.1 Peptidase family M48 [Aliiroseovarius halocynthiae]
MSTHAQEWVFADLAQGERAHLTRVRIACHPEALVIGMPEGDQVTWRWDDVRRLRDQADRRAMVLSRKGDPLTRLYLTDASVQGYVTRHAKYMGRRHSGTRLSKVAVWAGGAVASVAVIIFLLVPLMAAQLAEILPPEGEKALGDTTFEQIRTALSETAFEDRLNICDDPAGNAAMQSMYTRLNPEADLPYDVQIHILDHPMVNAFALPGGRIVFFRGLLEEAENPDEVAAVLAHEIGHVVHRDPTRDALRSAGSLGVLGLLFGDFAGGTITLFLANQLINASYSQAAEARADDYAHGLLEKANISPVALGTFFQRLHEEHGDAEGIVAHFASHPQMADRISAAQAAVDPDRSYDTILDAQAWRSLQTACGGAKDATETTEEFSKKAWPATD